MYVQSCNDSAEHATALLSVDLKEIQSHSLRSWLLLKMLLRVTLSMMLALSLILCVVYGQRHGERSAQIEKLAKHPDKDLDVWAAKQHAREYSVRAPGHGEMSISKTHIFTQNSAVFSAVSKRARKKFHASSRAKINIFVKILDDLVQEDLLKLGQKVLCLDAQADREVAALQERGFKDVHGIGLLPAHLKSRHTHKHTRTHKLADQKYEFVLTSMFDRMPHPAQFVTEIESALKVGGFAAMHVSLNKWRNAYIKSNAGGDVKPVTLLFQHSEIVYVSSAYAPGLDTLIVFKKITHVKPTVIDQMGMNSKQLATHPATMTQQIMNQVKVSSRHKLRKYSQDHRLATDM